MKSGHAFRQGSLMLQGRNTVSFEYNHGLQMLDLKQRLPYSDEFA